MIYGVSHVVSKNPQYLSSVLCERVLDVGPILGLMTQVQEDFLKIIENLQSWDILPIAAVVYHCFRCSDEIFRLAKIEVADNAKGDLSMLIDHFKLTFSFVIKEALDKKAASFKVIKVFSYAQGLYYLKHVAGRRETKASIFLGNFYDIEYDWMKLLLRAGRRGFYMYLCSAFEVELSNVGDEKRERIGRYLVKNRNT
ncbi:hypothetical protein RND81_11G048200 [Saponaria officinalis]|uniref:Uncharacterized protein n=1 Tax=Saponaria officinalis TaxID=3572 RepID=A0AAW1HGY7_SAPOF